jgi:hypothetical protein
VRALCRAIRVWTAFAFIVSGIVSPILASPGPMLRMPSQWDSGDGKNFVTEFSSVSWGSRKRVFVICPSPYENATPAGLSGDQFFAADREVECTYPRFGGNKGLSWPSLIQIGKIEILGNIAVKNLHAIMVNHFFCWRVPGVLKYDHSVKCCNFVGRTNGCQTYQSDGNIRALCRDHSLSGVGRLAISDFPHRDYRLVQFESLISKNEQLASKDGKLQEPNNDEVPVGRLSFPVIRRFLIAVFGVLFGLGLSFWGWVKLDDNRRVFGTALICVGWLISVSGLGLLWLAAFPSTWGWWL